MEYEKSASGSVYLIKSDKGYWLPGGFGYTSNKAEAGRFSVADMASLNLDGCTLFPYTTLFRSSAKTSLSAPASFSVTDMKDQKDKQTGDLLASPDAVRQARYAERMKAKGMRQRKFWLTDDEYEALRECLEELRAAQGGGSDPASA